MYPGLERERGVGVAQVVEPDLAHAGLFDQRDEVVRDIVRAQRMRNVVRRIVDSIAGSHLFLRNFASVMRPLGIRRPHRTGYTSVVTYFTPSEVGR